MDLIQEFKKAAEKAEAELEAARERLKRATTKPEVRRGQLWKHDKDGFIYMAVPLEGSGMNRFTLVCIKAEPSCLIGNHYQFGKGFDCDEHDFSYLCESKDLHTFTAF